MQSKYGRLRPNILIPPHIADVIHCRNYITDYDGASLSRPQRLDYNSESYYTDFIKHTPIAVSLAWLCVYISRAFSDNRIHMKKL